MADRAAVTTIRALLADLDEPLTPAQATLLCAAVARAAIQPAPHTGRDARADPENYHEHLAAL